MALPASSFSHIGDLFSAIILAALQATPFAFLTYGPQKKIVSFLLSKAISWLASRGVILLNIGAENVQIAVARSNFDGTMESAIRLVEEIRRRGETMAPEQIEAIDKEVIEAFRKFARMTRKKKQ